MKFLLSILLLVRYACGSNDSPVYILAIGDSNGASDHGWVVQLQKFLPEDSIVNYSIPGNTIGFDNLEQERLNTLKNIDQFLLNTPGSIAFDKVVILLGTNDCKAVFQKRQHEVKENMQLLIKRLHAHPKIVNAALFISTPPPYGSDKILAEKYQGGDQCVRKLIPAYQALSEEMKVGFINIYEPLKAQFNELSPDGVHLTQEGQVIIAQQIFNHITK